MLCHWSHHLSASIPTKFSALLDVWIAMVCVLHSNPNNNFVSCRFQQHQLQQNPRVACEFQQHADQSCHQVHHKLETQCTGIITDVKDVRIAKDEDIPVLVNAKSFECTSEQQTAQLKLSKLFKECAMTMKWHTCNPDSRL